MQKLTGEYTLRRWNQANRPVMMAVSVDSGELRIDDSGSADWELIIWASGSHPQGPPPGNRSRIKCGGSVISASQELHWVPDPKRTVSIDWSDGIQTVSKMVRLAFCGADYQEPAPFKLHYEQPSAGRATLEMINSEGIFVWVKE